MDLLASYGEDDSSPPENEATDTDTKHSDTVSPRFGSKLDDEWASFEKMIAGDGTSSSTQEVSAADQFFLNGMISYPGMGATNCWQGNEDDSTGIEQSEESRSLSSPGAAGIDDTDKGEDDTDKGEDDQEDDDAFFLMRQRIKERERSSESDSSDSSRSSSPSSSRSQSPEMFEETVEAAPASEEVQEEPPQSQSDEKQNSPAEKQLSPAEKQKSPNEKQKSPAEKQKSPAEKQKSPVAASRSRSPERKKRRKRSRSQRRSRSRNKKKSSRKRSKSREKHRSSKKHKRSHSQSRDKKRHSSHSRHKDRRGSRERKRSKSRDRKDNSSSKVHRSRSKERKSSHSEDLKHSQNKVSKERDSKDRGQIGSKDMKRSHSKERKKSRSPERKHKRSRSRERKSQRSLSKDRRSHSRERRSRSRSRGRQRSSRSRSRSRSRSPNKPLTFKEKMRQQLLKVGRMLGDSSTENTTAETKEPPSAMALNTKALFEAAKSSVTTGVTPQMALLQTMAAMHQKAQEMTGIAVPKYYNPAAVNPLKYAEQVQKRKLLWSKTKDHKEEKEAQWQSTAFALDNDGKMANKFRKLMGMKENEEGRVAEKDEKMTDEQKKKQDELFSRLDKEYEFARMATHTHRGIGLGFQSQSQTFPPNTIK